MLIAQTQAVSSLNLQNPVISHKQSGVVLVIALIILVAMTLAGIALVRSVDTANIIAGNLAFQQSATHSAEAGIETAIGQIETTTANALQFDVPAGDGYFAATPPGVGNPDLATNESWDAFWIRILDTEAIDLAADGNGNSVSYVIQRLCNATGAPADPATGCATVKVDSKGNSLNNPIPLIKISQYYYRITARVAGPRNTVNYIQAIVAK